MNCDYRARLELMEAWYRQLVGLDEREQILLRDYEPHVGTLGSLHGRVLDIGGGAGIAARFLDPAADYVVADPSDVWDSPEWVEFGRRFRRTGPQPQFVKAGGEALPFGDCEFDSALSFWSLNHSADPSKCVAEMVRVLKPGGVAVLVVDDVEPGWAELLTDGANRVLARLFGARYESRIKLPLRRALRMKLGGCWPTHDDHLPLRQRSLERILSRRMRVTRRRWADGSIAYELVKR